MLLIEPENDLSVRMGFENVALGLELRSQFLMVINLTVVTSSTLLSGAAHRLSAGVR
jgi:hypothetical protein